MNSKTIFKKLNVVEERLDLSKFVVDGIDVWPMLRFQFVLKLNSVVLGGDSESQNYLSRVREKARLIPSSLLGLITQTIKDLRTPNPGPSDILFLTDTSARRMKMDGKWLDAFVDPILDHYEPQGVNYTILQTSQRFLFRSPGMRRSHSLTWVMILSYARSIFWANRVRFSDEFLEYYSIYEAILDELKVCGGQVYLSELKLELSYIRQLIPVFERYLNKVNPKLVFLVPYNGYAGRALTYVCNLRGIQSVDIQHGVQGDYHPAYAQFGNIPEEGFNTLPCTFLTWSENDTSVIHKWSQQVHGMNVKTLGNLLEVTFHEDNQRSMAFDELFKKTFHKKQRKYFILISLIWDHFLPDEFKTLMEKSPSDYYFLIRFHPSTTLRERQLVKLELSEMNINNYDVESASELPLYALLRNVDLNVTQRSTTVIEAANFDVVSFISDKIGIAYYSELIRSGKAKKYHNEKDIYIHLSSQYGSSLIIKKNSRINYEVVLNELFDEDLNRTSKCDINQIARDEDK
jgi:hypothetical protein